MGPPAAGLASLLLSSWLWLASEGAAEGPPVNFLYQVRAECFFSNGTGGTGGEEPHVRFLLRNIYDRQEVDRFDSDLGRFVALAPISEPDVERWNKDPDALRSMMATVDICRHNYGIFDPFSLRRKIQPKMRITSDYKAPSHNTLLICFVDSFFPAKIKIRWLRNGKEEKGDQVMTSGLIDNGDWTYQMHEMLETQPERGDVYACQVEHDSFASPASIEWRPQSDAAKSKMWTGVVGLVLGVVFVAAGLSLYVKKGCTVPRTTVGLME
nr:PREDICTED: H-2 class II histocompatibility antigen, E-S beta chain [Anolis carolinensis]|eukprot:XP_008119271.1 PREDICTED: H-2 class II histocompatibility antigen, E-S beta chain [Anolis carolinensis]